MSAPINTQSSFKEDGSVFSMSVFFNDKKTDILQSVLEDQIQRLNQVGLLEEDLGIRKENQNEVYELYYNNLKVLSDNSDNYSINAKGELIYTDDMGVKNLGLIRAILSGTAPPENIRILWYDTNTGINIHKFYNVTTQTWEPLAGGSTGVSVLRRQEFTATAGQTQFLVTAFTLPAVYLCFIDDAPQRTTLFSAAGNTITSQMPLTAGQIFTIYA